MRASLEGISGQPHARKCESKEKLFGASAGSIANLKEDQPVAEIGKRT
jgi:hypothetical protein